MITDSNNEKELVRLCGLMVDDGLGDPDMQRLSELLTSDVSARAFYRIYMDAHARLLLHHEPVPVLDEPIKKPADQLAADREPLRSAWWQFAAATVLLLMAGLNVIQSAGNLEAAKTSRLALTSKLTDAEAQLLAEDLGLMPSDLKRLAFLSSQSDNMLMLPVSSK